MSVICLTVDRKRTLQFRQKTTETHVSLQNLSVFQVGLTFYWYFSRTGQQIIRTYVSLSLKTKYNTNTDMVINGNLNSSTTGI